MTAATLGHLIHFRGVWFLIRTSNSFTQYQIDPALRKKM